MENAVDEDGVPVRAGCYRDHPGHNGNGLVYAEHQDISTLLEKLLHQLQTVNLASVGTLEACVTIARFVHGFLVIHPFQNGNGRMARLTVSYLLREIGAPFVVPLTNGHQRNRKHYFRALRAGDRGNISVLVLYILECYARVCDNAILLILLSF